MVGLYNTGLVIHIPQAVMGVALGFSAMGQFVCGIAELLLGNTFGGTSMLTYSGFWFSYGIMFSGGGGFFDTAMESGMHELEMCLGLMANCLCDTSCYLLCCYIQAALDCALPLVPSL